MAIRSHSKETVNNLQLPAFANDHHANTSSMVGVVPRGDENMVPTATTPFILSEALPVVPPKLVKRIVRGDYIDIAEILSDNMELECRRALAESEGIGNMKQSGRREIPDTLSWLHCFSLYAAVLCTKYPGKAKQFWVYQALRIGDVVDVAGDCMI